jgi:hypothetical protein
MKRPCQLRRLLCSLGMMPLAVQIQNPARAFAWRRRKQQLLATHWFEFFQTHVSKTEGCLRRQAERKVHRRKAAAGGEKAATAGKGNGTRSSCQASNAYRTRGFGQAVRELRDSQQVTGQPALQHHSVHSSTKRWQVVLYHARAVGQWVVVLLVAWHMQQDRGCSCQRGGWAWRKWQCGHGRLQCDARP